MKTNAPVKKVLRSLRPYLPLLTAAVVSALISVSLTLYIPVLIGHAIDRIIGQGQVFFADVAQILGYIGMAVGGVTVFQWLMQYFVNLVCYKTVRDLRRAMFRKLNTVPLSYIDTHAHG
ncbi:MAG: ABC transporter ATP-binding protein, partial [Ruminococcus sp.]|nr:ABC transporter ATP-binding protein [Ruminococcus sp.]